jgi:hypothetical protein
MLWSRVAALRLLAAPLKEDPAPQRAAALEVLQQVFLPYRKLGSYDVYRRQ